MILYAYAYNNRGFSYNSLGEYDQAIADLNEAIRLDSQHALAYSNRGYKDDKAIADYNERAACPKDIGKPPLLPTNYYLRANHPNCPKLIL
jgi:tetratricopeptide (TPR) repeat protein